MRKCNTNLNILVHSWFSTWLYYSAMLLTTIAVMLQAMWQQLDLYIRITACAVLFMKRLKAFTCALYCGHYINLNILFSLFIIIEFKVKVCFACK